MECLCAQTRPRFILSPERVLGEWSQNPSSIQGENPLYRKKKSSQRRIEPTTLHQAGQRAQHTTTELSRPRIGSALADRCRHVVSLCNFHLTVAARQIAEADPSVRYVFRVCWGTLRTHQTKIITLFSCAWCTRILTRPGSRTSRRLKVRTWLAASSPPQEITYRRLFIS